MVAVYGLLGSAALMVVVSVLAPFEPLFYACIAAIALLLALELAAVIGYQVQLRREFAHGYTSSNRELANAAQIDPRTGYVIREPGEKLLAPDERKRRIQEARELAKT